MEWSMYGFAVGSAIGMFLVWLILKVFLPTDADTRGEKRIRTLSCILVLVVSIVLGGYLPRTEVNMGDYDHKNCSGVDCSNPPVCKFYYFFEKNYYCIEHMELVYDSLAPEGVNFRQTKDRAGKGMQDAWAAAKQYAASELNLPADARFGSEGLVVYNNMAWIVRGNVTVNADTGNPTYIYFKTELAFDSADTFYVLDFSYDKS